MRRATSASTTHALTAASTASRSTTVNWPWSVPPARPGFAVPVPAAG